MSSESEWLRARIERTEALIEKVEDAIDQIGAGAQSYTLDTGQTRQVVTKADMSQLRNMLDSLENRRDVLRARLYGTGAVIVKPGF